MIIDLILDRNIAGNYNPRDFYTDVMKYESFLYDGKKYPISTALDGGTEEDIKRELCSYVDENGYNTAIKDYINSVDWL